MLQFYFLAYIQLFWMNNGGAFFKMAIQMDLELVLISAIGILLN
jgi:hypothetical protein